MIFSLYFNFLTVEWDTDVKDRPCLSIYLERNLFLRKYVYKTFALIFYRRNSSIWK